MKLNRKKIGTIGMFVTILMTVLTACKKDTTIPLESNIHDYLLGSWERTNDQEGRNTFESWSKNGKAYKGHGYTMIAGDTIWQEHLRLFKRDTTWTLEISGVNESPTPFVLTSHTSHSFVAENPENEFPKTINYQYFDNTITAIISDGETEIPFIFWRVVAD